MANQMVYMFHGYTSFAADHWFPWLEERVEHQLGIPFKKLNFPDSNHPDPEIWSAYCDREIQSEGQLTLVGHSLGCIQVLRYIEQHNISQLNVLLVSGFDEPIWTLPSLDAFTAHPVDYTNVLPKISRVTVISAMNDTSVPYPYTLAMARHLHAKFVLMPTGHHFTDTGHDKQLPIAFEELRQLLENK